MWEREVNLSNVISKRIYDNGWRDMTDQEQEENLEKIKAFLLSLCRKNSATWKAINRMSVNNLPGNNSTMERITADDFTAGQSYPDELRRLKAYLRREL
jgi:hypothetical protein